MRNNTTTAARGMKLNHLNKRIEVTKRFLSLAAKPNAPEAAALAEQMAKFPTYEIVEVKPEGSETKVSYKNLTLERMLGYVHLYSSADVDFFEKCIKVYLNEKTGKIEKGKYATIKKVFLDNYGKAYNELQAKDIVQIDMKIKELNPEGKEGIVHLLTKEEADSNSKDNVSDFPVAETTEAVANK